MDAARARTARLPLEGQGSGTVLGGPPETVTLRSGLVVLEPGRGVGAHSTGDHEEILVVLEGEGELRVQGVDPLPLAPDRVGYCPPRTEHDVVNTGTTRLRYLYVVAKVPEAAGGGAGA
ncbi:MAG: hypothetical protein Kow0092_34750 [Deferrisomatales bacterium]